MAHRINWLNQALRELFTHCQALERSDPEQSARLENEAFQAPELLKQFPQLGRLVPEAGPEHRALLFFSRRYWLVYRVRPQSIVVIGVISTRQDFAKAWESRKRG